MTEKEYNREYHKKNKEKIKERKKLWYEANKDKVSKYNNAYSKDKSKQNIIEKAKEKYYIKNKDIINNKSIKYYEKNKNGDRLKTYQKEYRIKNRDKIKINLKKYRQANKEKINLYVKNKRKENVLFKLSCNLRSLIYNAFNNKGYCKDSKTEQILGCTYDEFKQHIESQFESWMSWNNYGLYNGTEGYGWDIDHIIPLKTAQTEEELIKLNHYSNLQPLCGYYNRITKRNLVK